MDPLDPLPELSLQVLLSIKHLHATSLVQILSLKPRLHCSSNPDSIHFSHKASSNPPMDVD